MSRIICFSFDIRRKKNRKNKFTAFTIVVVIAIIIFTIKIVTCDAITSKY